MGKAENATLAACKAWIIMHGGAVVRVQSGGRVINDAKYGARFMRMAEPGTADLIGVLRGVPIAIEVKTPTGKVQDSQREWGEAWTRAGGVYIIARGVGDLYQMLAWPEKERT